MVTEKVVASTKLLRKMIEADLAAGFQVQFFDPKADPVLLQQMLSLVSEIRSDAAAALMVECASKDADKSD